MSCNFSQGRKEIGSGEGSVKSLSVGEGGFGRVKEVSGNQAPAPGIVGLVCCSVLISVGISKIAV